MKKFLLLAFVFTLGFCWICAGEDLGELAKKEKARREELARKGVKSRVLTNQDVEDLKAQLAIQSSTVEAESNTESATGETTQATAEETSTTSESAEATTADEQLKDIEAQKEEQEAKAKEAKGAIDRGGLFHTRDIGQQYKVQREANEKIRELDKKSDELKKESEEAEDQE